MYGSSWVGSVYASCCFCGFQGADSDAEQLSLTEQLFDAALGEFSVVSRGQPCLLVGDFNVEPTKIPCPAKGISAGLWVDMEEAWALAAGLRPAVTCKRAWDSVGGHRRDFMVGCPLTLCFLVRFWMIGGLLPILLFAPYLIVVGGLVLLHRLSSVPPFGPLLGCLLLIRAGVPSLLRFGGFGRFMMSVFSLCLVMMPFCWMLPLLLVMFLGLGLFGLVLLSLHLLMLIDLVVVLFLVRIWFWVGVVFLLGLLSLVVIRFGRLVAMLLTLMMLLMSFCIVILLLLPSLICDEDLKP